MMLLLLLLMVASLSFGTAQVQRINCGGSSFTDQAGNSWDADRNFGRQTRVRSVSSNVRINNANNPTDLTTSPTLYRTQRVGDITYRIPVESGSFTVHIHLCELEFSRSGARVFDIIVEGVRLPNVDIFNLAGRNTATKLIAAVQVSDGFLTITTNRNQGDPLISGVAIFPATASPLTITSVPPTTRALLNRAWTYQVTTSQSSDVTFSLSSATVPASISATGLFSYTPALPQAGTTQSFTYIASAGSGRTQQTFTVRVDDSFYRINGGGPEVIENDIRWLGDENPSPWINSGLGFIEPTSPNINRAADPSVPNQVMQSHRFTRTTGVYHLPVPAGTYDVDFYLAEIWGGARNPGVRNFGLTVEGQILFSNLDPTGAFGFLTMGIKTASSVAVNDGELTIELIRGTADNPEVNAFRVRPGTPCASNRQCGSQCCSESQTCQGNTNCVSSVQCNPPFVIRASDGKCVFPTTPGICPRNEVDCAKGCATLGTATDPAIVCQGGTCENGVCVPHTLTASELNTIKTRIRDFVTNQNQVEAASTDPNVRVGDFIGGCTRLMFHDAGPARHAGGCAFVRDQVSASCNGRDCEFASDNLSGMRPHVGIIHDFYNDGAFWPLLNLPDFIYLFGAEGLRVVSSGRANINFRTGRQPCRCLTTRPFSACANPPSFPNTMPGAESTLAQIRDIMQTQMAFQEHEWMCLTGAHALGRAARRNSGYGGAWTQTPATFDNSYWRTMNNDIWIPENGTDSTNDDIPSVGHQEYRLPGTTRMMLRSDMCPYWDTETRHNCPVTHGTTPDFCPPREPQFSFMQTLLNIDTFFNCFNPAFQKLIEMGNSGLQTPS
jgi:hypothetical protein